jgi:hypothetical protein
VEAQHDPVVPEGVPPELVPLYTEYPTCMVQVRQKHCARVQLPLAVCYLNKGIDL